MASHSNTVEEPTSTRRTPRMPSRVLVAVVAAASFGAGVLATNLVRQPVDIWYTGTGMIAIEPPALEQIVQLGQNGQTRMRLPQGEWVAINDELKLRVP